MGLNDGFAYPPLTTDTQTRILLLAPGQGDEPIHCFYLVIDLDAEGELERLGPSCEQSPELSHIEVKDMNGAVLSSFFAPEIRRMPAEKGGGLCPYQRYTALSYVWGDQSNPHDIFLNGKPFRVGESLYLALRKLRRSMKMIKSNEGNPKTDDILKERMRTLANHTLPVARLLWIDAMCINQAEVREREAQVKLMARIYRQADHVHADLGYSDTCGEELLRLIQIILAAGSACDSDVSRRQPLTHSKEGPDSSSTVEEELISGVTEN
jgi:hypothetical protein